MVNRLEIKSPSKLVFAMCVAQILAMAGFANFAVVLNELSFHWSLSSAQAGWISGIYYVGYVSAVPVLVGLTDNYDPKKIYLFGVLCGVIGSLGFGFLADSFFDALVFRFIAGISLAGTYMPGLQILSNRLSDSEFQKVSPWYLSAFSLGTASSFYFSGQITSLISWQAVFIFSGIIQICCFILVVNLIARKLPRIRVESKRHPLDFRPVFRNKAALGYIFGYMGHTFELIAYRTWIVAFLIYSASLTDTEIGLNTVATLAAFFSLLGMPASVFGANLGVTYGRRKIISTIMLTSFLIGSLLGFAGSMPFYFVLVIAALHSIFIMSDSAALTAGVVSVSTEDERGATLAVHSVMGFSGGFFGPLVVGLVLDLGGGQQSSFAWSLAFLATASGSLIGLLILQLLISKNNYSKMS